MSGLELRNVHLAVPRRALVAGLDLQVAPGEIVALMGPSGCGKSTLLAFASGAPVSGVEATGEIWLEGRRVEALPPEARRIGILFQDDLLFPHLSVGGNLAFALPRAVRGHQRRHAVDEALAEAGLDGFADRDPATLSGGQRARVAVMRSLLARPRALLLDEAFAALDAASRESFRGFVFGHTRRASLPVIMATHDPADAAAAGARVLSPWVGAGG